MVAGATLVSTRLQPINLLDFSGGLNLRRTNFQLDDNESPGMLNVNMDQRGGFVTRAGWSAWNATSIIGSPSELTWQPRNAEMHLYSSGAMATFISNQDRVWAAQPGQNFADLGITASAAPHLCDFAGWGDTMYLACGRTRQAAKVVGPPAAGNPAALIPKAATANWNNDYTIINNNVFPGCEHAEAHGGYMFVANTQEDSIVYPNRLRWSHPDQPEDWAKADFIDILQGGSHITGLRSFRDHLLIFKVDSVWALYGYDQNSWQLIKVSASIGTPHPGAITKSEDAVYFYSASSRNGIYRYQGDNPVLISDPIRRATDAITEDRDVWLGWVSRRLWCSLPWDPDPYFSSHGSLFVFDPEMSPSGSWIRYKPARGTVACIVERSDVGTENPLIVTCGCTGFAGVLKIMANPDIAGDVFTSAEGIVGYRCYYRTSWKHAGWPELQKSWLRARVIARVPVQDVKLRMDTFWNYDSDNSRRTHVFDVVASGGVFWRLDGYDDAKGGGFDWSEQGSAAARGADWRSGARIGDTLVRPTSANATRAGGSLGWARAVMLEFQPEDYTEAKAWAIDAVVLKVNLRRFTT